MATQASKLEQVKIAYPNVDSCDVIEISGGRQVRLGYTKNAALDYASKHIVLQKEANSNANGDIMCSTDNIKEQCKALAYILLNDKKAIENDKFYSKRFMIKRPDSKRKWMEIYNTWNVLDMNKVFQNWLGKSPIAFFLTTEYLMKKEDALANQDTKSSEAKPE